MPPIELEIRAEIKASDFQKTLAKLRRVGKKIKSEKRLIFMGFGRVQRRKFDVKVRITKGEKFAEVVVKKGETHAASREEAVEKIPKKQFIGFVKMFALFGFWMKVGEREIHHFAFPKKAVVTLGRTGKICFVEIERMTTKAREKKDKQDLKAIAKELDLKIITAKQFYDLCDRMTKKNDWRFLGREKDYQKLARLLNKY
ncbi:hypothetical protein ACFL2B_01895 [Patescibacteria group bacterium]